MSKRKSIQEEIEQEEQEQKEREKEIREEEKRKQKESGLKLHHYRFVKFIDYLKRHEAEIKIIKKDDATGERYPLTYNLGERDGLPFKDLIIEALNIHPDRAEDYITNSGKLKSTHAIGERFRGLGSVITSIEFYYSGDTPLGEKSSLNEYYNPFAIRLPGKIEDVEDKIDPEKLVKKTYSNFLNIQFKEHIFSNFKLIMEEDEPRVVLGTLNATTIGLFSKESKQLKKYLIKEANKDYNFFRQFESLRKEIFQKYCELVEKLPAPLFIPGYIDFKLPRRIVDHKWDNYKKNKFHYKVEKLLNNIDAISLEELINYRYEILWYLVDNNLQVDNWPLKVQVLLLIINYEYYAISEGLLDFESELSDKQTRFIVFGSDDGRQIKAQKDSLNFDELISLLHNYQFNKGFTRAFEVNDYQLLNYPVYKYPEVGAVKQRTSKFDMSDYLYHAFSDYFRNQLTNGLYVPFN